MLRGVADKFKMSSTSTAVVLVFLGLMKLALTASWILRCLNFQFFLIRYWFWNFGCRKTIFCVSSKLFLLTCSFFISVLFTSKENSFLLSNCFQFFYLLFAFFIREVSHFEWVMISFSFMFTFCMILFFIRFFELTYLLIFCIKIVIS